MTLLAWLPWGVLVASVLGSWHCAAMCGPLTTAFCETRVAFVTYHIGRMTIYILLGSMVGGVGHHLLGTSSVISRITGLMFGMALIVIGLRIWSASRGSWLRFPAWLSHGYAYLARFGRRRWGPPVLGAMSVFLPCGWLHVNLLAAAATASPWRGGLLMALFAMGTLPGFVGLKWIVQAARVCQPNYRHWISGALIALGLMTLYWRVVLLTAHPRCH